MAENGIQAHCRETINDAQILDAWARRVAAYERLDQLAALESSDGGTASLDERKCHGIVNGAEVLIRSNIAQSPAGVGVQLWCSLFFIDGLSRAAQTAAIKGDLEALAAMEDELDWDAKFALAALRSLNAMGAN